MRRLGMLLAAIGLASMTSGCGALILAHQDAVALSGSASATFAVGSSRREVEAKLGKPESSRRLPDGSRADRYTYTIRDPRWHKQKRDFALISMMTVGFAEPVLVPLAEREALKHRDTATFTYDADDVLLAYGPPPPFGPPEDAVEPLSFTEIRDRCRAENPIAGSSPEHAFGYHQCVVRRIAIWGIE